MKTINRRQFVGGAILSGGASTLASLAPSAHAVTVLEPAIASNSSLPDTQTAAGQTPIDFRYSPVLQQTAFCFPDDPYKSLINEKGELLYGYSRDKGTFYFPLKFSFSLYGMREEKVTHQAIESPSVPIVRTVLEREDAIMTLTTFATNHADEGRVDNVLLEVRPRQEHPVTLTPIVQIHITDRCQLKKEGEALIVSRQKDGEALIVARVLQGPNEGSVHGGLFDTSTNVTQQLTLHAGVASATQPYLAFLRFPQQGQQADKILSNLDSPQQHLEEVRKFWTLWSPFHDPVSWSVPQREGEFVAACARNILQAREVRDGKLTFQVGPTCYRGLWVVDGNFILEAARYLGYDKEAIEGLKTTWSKQQPNGQIVAAGGNEHYKDTAIAMFTLVRQCELSQDWSLLHDLEPQVIAGIQFFVELRARARAEGSALGRYGLLAKGFADGGFDGTRNELTNTLWAMAGLRAIGAAGAQQNLPRVAAATKLYQELYDAFGQAAANEMRSYDGRFEYLPMLLKEEPEWDLPNPWDRPRPQCAQWALSHTIFPGRVFDQSHPVVKGHVALMEAIRREDIPAETGWSHHEAVWTYNAPFVSEVYLWLGKKQAAYDMFTGFLNHASPKYCWREEQPLQNAMVGSYVGDMPHNWASAECIRYMRHILALEDGAKLRLLAGITQGSLATGKPYVLHGTPTRFGRLDLGLEPLDRKQGWRLTFRRQDGPGPGSISLPAALADTFQFAHSEGIQVKHSGDEVLIDPSVRQWAVTWKA